MFSTLLLLVDFTPDEDQMKTVQLQEGAFQEAFMGCSSC